MILSMINENLFITFEKTRHMDGYMKALKKAWHFIWDDNSVWSWIANIAIAFVLIKFLVYPSLGFILSTTHPVVAVVSESMEHNGNFDKWWKGAQKGYTITKDDFMKFPLENGFNKGDIMILKGKKPENIRVGDVIVFWSSGISPQTGNREPIIHRVVKKWDENGVYYFQTKGDNNPASISNAYLDETKVSQNQVVGNAVLRVPLLGYIKIWFVDIIKFLVGLFA